MGQYNGAVITTAGQAVIAQAIGGAELTITKVVTSATAIPPGTDLTALTAIADVEQTEQPTSVQVFNDNIVQISTRFSNAGVAAAYLIQTLGVFGQVTGGAETLLAVSTAVTPDQMPAEDAIAPSAFIYNIQLTVQSADQITVTVNDAGTATVADVRALGELIDSKIGSLADLSTDNKDSLVDAVNEVDNHAYLLQSQIYDNDDAYSPTKSYYIGDICVYNNSIYKCIEPCNAGAWSVNQSCFEKTTLTNIANDLSAIIEEEIALSYGSKTANLYFRQKGGFLSILCTKDDAPMTLPTSWTYIGTLSIIGTQSNTTRFIPFISSNGLSGTFRLYPDGAVRIIAHSSSAYWMQFSATALNR